MLYVYWGRTPEARRGAELGAPISPEADQVPLGLPEARSTFKHCRHVVFKT